MSRKCVTSLVLVLTLVFDGVISVADWSIDDPQSFSTVNQNDNLQGKGLCSSHPSTRWVGFGTDLVGGVESTDISVIAGP